MKIPVIAIVDSNASPQYIDFVIPGNDDAIKAIDLFMNAVKNAILAGQKDKKPKVELS